MVLDILGARRAKGMTQEDVAKNSGITRQYYAMIESGERKPKVSTAKRIAKILCFDWTEFFAESADEMTS